MSFWSGLGKIASVAGSVGASFVPGGGAALSMGQRLAQAAGAAAPVLGQMAGSRAAGKVADSNAINDQNRAMQDRGQNLNYALQQEFQNRLGLKDAEAGLMDTRLRQTREGDLQHNVQDVVIPDNDRVHVAHWSGGLRPSAMGPNARDAGAQVSNSALASLGHENLPMAPGMVGNIPNLMAQPKPGMLDHILGVATPALSLYAALNPTKKPPVQGQQIPNPDPTDGPGGWL